MRPSAVGCASLDPRLVIKTVAFNNKSVTFPVSDAPPIRAVFGRFCREFPAVHPDGAPCLRQLKQLHDFVPLHNELNSVVVDMQPWPSGGIAIELRSSALPGCIFRVERFPILVFFADRLLVPLPSIIREQRQVFNAGARTSKTIAKLARAVETPYSGKVMGIKGVTFDLVLLVRSF